MVNESDKKIIEILEGNDLKTPYGRMVREQR